MTGSISFDRAADFYDATRALESDIARAITTGILLELRKAGAEHMLEVGAGTGRIAYPLAARGIRVTALDVSLPMLSKFREKIQQEDIAPDFLLGDATRLPFAGGCFPAILTVHVLHLIFGWRAAIAELSRVIAPGGVVLREAAANDFEDLPEHRASRDAYDGILARRGFVPRPRAGIDETNDYVRETGGSVRTFPLGTQVEMRTEEGFIQALRKRLHSNMWEIPDDIYQAFVDEYEEWASTRFGDLSIERPVTHTYALDVWTF